MKSGENEKNETHEIIQDSSFTGAGQEQQQGGGNARQDLARQDLARWDFQSLSQHKDARVASRSLPETAFPIMFHPVDRSIKLSTSERLTGGDWVPSHSRPEKTAVSSPLASLAAMPRRLFIGIRMIVTFHGKWFAGVHGWGR